ncbi:MAG: hypothetical protein C0456_17480 [Hyphomonas sp.]|uniref:hypothetical protein n=1 Tax=Hyphomonas sp. TaxID=87 RepID=UPI001D52CAA1|nr:hypothetical protein [Hyphomonas sp.]MBA4228406.1 hypothetical protein [Hyphomonas sp.]
MENAAPQPTDDTVYALLERARLFILDMVAFIDGIFGRLGDVPLTARLARHLTRHALVPAELALRRAILIIAADLPVPVLKTRPRAALDSPAPRAAAAAPAQAKPPRPPRFNMNEPPPRKAKAAILHPETDYLTEDHPPRILVLTDDILAARSAPPAPAPPPRDPTASFRRRFAALQTALNDPRGEAERWARRRIREMARPGAVQRSLPVPLALPRLARAIQRNVHDLIRDLTDLTNTCFCHDTS